MGKIKAFLQTADGEWDRKKIAKILRITSLALFLFVVLYVAAKFTLKLYGIGVIVTPSIEGSVVVYEKDFKLANMKNKIVLFLLPKETPYYKKHTNFLKYVRCEAGDKLMVQGLDYYCNDNLIGTAKTTDMDGKEVAQFVFNGQIPNGKYFVMGTHERSYDSRYWGFVDSNLIKGVGVWKL